VGKINVDFGTAVKMGAGFALGAAAVGLGAGVVVSLLGLRALAQRSSAATPGGQSGLDAYEMETGEARRIGSDLGFRFAKSLKRAVKFVPLLPVAAAAHSVFDDADDVGDYAPWKEFPSTRL
jgi:hypothetical protein